MMTKNEGAKIVEFMPALAHRQRFPRAVMSPQCSMKDENGGRENENTEK